MIIRVPPAEKRSAIIRVPSCQKEIRDNPRPVRRDPRRLDRVIWGYRGGWSRTNIRGSKGRCPTIERRPGSKEVASSYLTEHYRNKIS